MPWPETGLQSRARLLDQRDQSRPSGKNYINLQCLSFPAARPLGNLGRNTLRAPALEDFRFFAVRTTICGRENEASAPGEAFNVSSRANFGARVASVINGRGAYFQAMRVEAPTSQTSRQIQFGTKLIW